MNNETTVSGIITSVEFNHELLGEKFFIVNISVGRLSNTSDIIPVMVSDRVATITEDNIGDAVKVIGQFRSYNRCNENKIKLVLFVFANEVMFCDAVDSVNEISLIGFICKQPTYRETPLGRQISDVLIAVNRSYGKSDYIPCVVWGRNAKYASTLNVGDYIRLVGRVQSREYIKEDQTHVAYEVSVQTIENMA